MRRESISTRFPPEPQPPVKLEVIFCVRGVTSPLLSNVYLHYVLDQWTDQGRQAARGNMTIVRYADDAILGFERQDEAERYLRELQEHLREYGLELNEEKTRLIRSGRFAALNRAERGEGKPETFTFLGLQHICGKNRLGRFEVRRIRTA